MNKIQKMKAKILARIFISFGIALLCLFSLRPAFAASSDTIQLLVTPVVDYGVTISSVNTSGYDFGLVNLGDVTHSTAAIVVQNTGNVASQWQLRVTNSQNWIPAASVAQDQFVLMGVFTSTASAAEVNTNEFTDGQDEILTNYQTANGSDNSGKYNAGTTLNAIPPSGQANSKRNLWLKLKMPPTSSVGTQQQFHLYITAVQTGQ